MSITDGHSNGILDGNDSKNSDDLMLSSVNNLIVEHRNTFLSSKNNFTLENYNNSNNLKRSKNHFRKYRQTDSCQIDIKPSKKPKDITIFRDLKHLYFRRIKKIDM